MPGKECDISVNANNFEVLLCPAICDFDILCSRPISEQNTNKTE